jgi:xanthine dehydrogenase YagT iron-sulfur-binding subunit
MGPESADNVGAGSVQATLSRRSFISQASIASVAATGASSLARADSGSGPSGRGVEKTTARPLPGTVPITLKVNGETHALQIDPRATLLDTLRETLHLTGTKKGCDHGQCGACTVHINGRRANSCLALAAMHQDAEITTIEGLARDGKLHPMQAAFVEHDGFQCGYCTPGQIMSAVGMLNEPWGTTDAEVREAMSGNICRCGAYTNILAAVQSARGKA